jgi:hypothetical protein
MTHPLLEYYRCEDNLADTLRTEDLQGGAGFFRLADSICYGPCSAGPVSQTSKAPLSDYSEHFLAACVKGDGVLPFDPAQILTNLRMELYTSSRVRNSTSRLSDLLHQGYYLMRPLLPVALRSPLQRLRLQRREAADFPRWPVDCTVDNLAEEFLRAAMRAKKQETVPFIWFWPDGMTSAAIMTHDVEARAGLEFCDRLMDLDDSFGIKSSFQVIPESRYTVPPGFLKHIDERQFEVNVHDLNHDGHLFRDREEFMRRVSKINHYLREFGAQGFRSGIMYRNQQWLGDLDAAYDMSVPNSAHLDPQSGGCCTVMPYFVGNVLELPTSMTQDYALFNFLQHYSVELWQHEIEMVREKHGLISFIVHPDYIIEDRPQSVYRALLGYLAGLRAEGSTWFALPRDINRWWRQRSQMKLVRTGSAWTITGQGSERATIAFARVEGNHIRYCVQPAQHEFRPGPCDHEDAASSARSAEA